MGKGAHISNPVAELLGKGVDPNLFLFENPFSSPQ